MAKKINVDELIEFCSTSLSMLHEHYNSMACAALRGVVEFAKENAVEVESVNGWISVKDRLPENDGLYIVCKTIGDHQIVFEARWQGGNWKSVVKNSQLDFITDWQPLPKPPKGE